MPNVNTAPGQRPLRVLHCPTVVAGNASSISQAERTLGIESETWELSHDTFPGYPSDRVIWAPGCGPVSREWRRWASVFEAMRNFDIVHFNFGRTLFPVRAPLYRDLGKAHFLRRWLYWLYANCFEMCDMAWMRWAGCGIVMTYQGDDARQGDYLRSHFRIHFADEVGPDYYEAGNDACKKRRIAKVGRWAHRILCVNPDLLHVLPGASFMPCSTVNPSQIPIADSVPAPPARPVILHAPTHRQVKGTRFVIEAVNRLQSEGISCELLLVEGLSHSEALRVYPRADLLVDQLLAGWYGGLAVELMAMGKPVIAYLREEDLHLLDPRIREMLPIIRAEPSTLYEVLKYWLTTGRTELATVGKKSREYVERWHDPVKIAQWLLDDVYRPLVPHMSLAKGTKPQ